MHVSIIILTKNPDERFRRLLEAVRRQDVEADVEIVVLDSGSRQSLDDVVKPFEVVLSHLPPEEFAHGRTRNRASELACGEVLVFLSQDAIPIGETWLRNLLAPLAADERVGVVYGRQVAYPETALDERFFYTYFYPERRVRLALGDTAIPYVDTAFLSDVNAAVRRSVWERIRFCDDIPWAEDKDFAFNALKAGVELVYEPTAAVFHSHSYSLRTLFQRRYRDGVAYSLVTARHGAILGGKGCTTSNLLRAGRYWAAKAADLVRHGEIHHLPYASIYDTVFFAAFGLGILHRHVPTMLLHRLGVAFTH